jgi:hypothetical protein
VPHSARSEMLSALQVDFARALLWRTEAVPPTLAGAVAPARRFNVYRNNVYASLTNCLAASFPVVARLVGAEFFAAMARVFIERFPPLSPALFEYGEDFPSFLREFEPARELPYLADVAQLEWLVGTAYHAPNAAPIAVSELSRFGDEAVDAGLELHPSCAIFLSAYPVLAIWRTNTHDVIAKPIDAYAGGEGVLIVRPEFEVALTAIDAATYAFVAALAARHSLEQAAVIAVELDPLFEVGAALALLFRSGSVVGIRPETAPFDRTQCPPMRMSPCAT